MCIASVQAETYYFHTDHLGSPQVVTDLNKAVVWQGNYHPFGEVTETVATVEQNLRFPGQYLDRESGLHYNYFRTYDPTIGRYAKPDPIGLAGGINTYLYVDGNPYVSIDRFGLQKYNGEVPPGNLPGGPWEPRSGAREGSFQGPKQNKGPRAICEYVPNEEGGNSPYWKTQQPNQKGWERFNLNGEPITPEQAHPGKNKKLPENKFLKLLPILGPLFEMTTPSPQRVPENSQIAPYM